MDILFDRDVRNDRVALAQEPVDGVDSVRKPYFDSVAEQMDLDEASSGDDVMSPAQISEQLRDLNDEVDHLRGCIDQLLDLLEAQSHVVDDVDLLFDRMGLTDRRVQRVEDAVNDRYDGPRRRAEDEA